MTTEEAKRRIDEDPDFIYMKRFDYSLAKLLQRYPDGAPTRVISQALMITESDAEQLYPVIAEKLRGLMGVEP